MADTFRSTSPRPQCSASPGRPVGSQPPTGIAPVCLWLLWQGAAGLSAAPSAARSRRWSSATSWLAGLLLLALALGPSAFVAPLASVPVIPALLLAGALGSSAVAGQLGGIVAPLFGLPARYEVLAPASRTHTGREYQPDRPTVR